MSAVKKITPHLHSLTCPDDIRKLPAWLTWRYETVAPEEKPRKVPYYASGKRRSGTQGAPEDVAQLVTFDAAVSAASRRGHDGVGMATLPDWGVTVIDFDRAVVSGALMPQVERAVTGTYAEYSPSGEGVHVVVKGSFPNKKNHGDKADPASFGVETFHSKGFVTWTGNPLPVTEILGAENTISPMSEALLGILTTRLLTARDRGAVDSPRQAVEPMGLHPDQITEMLAVIDPEEGGHDQWLRIGMAIHHETNGEGFDLWDEWSDKGATYPGRDNLQRRWDSFGGRSAGGITVRSLLKLASARGVNVGVIGADDFEDLGPGPDAVEQEGETFSTPLARNPFKLLTIKEFLDRPRPGWIIKGLMPIADLGVVYGASGAGKSFIMLELVMAIVRGIPWRGLRVRQGKVVYICAEGAGGFRNRVEAYCQHHGIDGSGLPLLILDAVPNLLDKAQVKWLCETIAAEPGVALVVCDTFAQMTPGADENAGRDMGEAIANIRTVGRRAAAGVILVHHAGKDAARGARGWSGIRAAADFEMEVTRDADDNRALNTTKQKDADDSASWGFRVQEMIIGLDEDDDPIKSAIVVENAVQVEAGVNGGKRKAKPEKKLGGWEQAILDVHAELSVGGDVLKSELILRAAERRPDKGTLRDRKKNVGHALKGLREGKDSTILPHRAEDGDDKYVALRS